MWNKSHVWCFYGNQDHSKEQQSVNNSQGFTDIHDLEFNMDFEVLTSLIYTIEYT
jgi:hypothetical protein